MVSTKSLICDDSFTEEEVTAIVNGLSQAGMKPAAAGAERYVLELAGLDRDRIPDLGRYAKAQHFIGSDFAAVGDVFFEGEDVYYLTLAGSYRMTRSGYVLRPTGDSGADEKGELEIGIVTASEKEADEKLTAFGTMVKEAAKSSLDGRRTRHMSFVWSDRLGRNSQLRKLIDAEDQEATPDFAPAQLLTDETAALEAMADSENRALLIQFSQAGFVREADLMNRRKPEQREKLQSSLRSLIDVGLIRNEFLLECKQTSSSLTRLRDREQLKSPEVAYLKCANCNRDFKDESLAEGYVVAELGKKLTAKSHWMTLWVTKLLVELGVPLEAIIWNVAENGEEVDLLVEVLGTLWVFELKDRAFGAGDAHALNYRRVRYRASQAVIITTDKVAKDARRVFDDLNRDSDWPGRGAAGIPVYIEGLGEAKPKLRQLLSSRSLIDAATRLSMLSAATGFDFGQVIFAKFGSRG